MRAARPASVSLRGSGLSSSRSKLDGLLRPFALERYFAPYEFTARRMLSCSDSEALSMAELLALADEETGALWRGLKLGYTESRGLPQLRREVARLYARVCDDDVLTVVPAEGIYLAMQALLEASRRVVVTSPGYQSLYEHARARGCDLQFWKPHEAQGWRFDPEDLRALVASGVDLVVMNFPHNPTGWAPTHDELTRIVAIVREAGAWLFTDEMYRFLERDAGEVPSAIDLYDKCVALGGLSKSFGAPGLRVGWLVCKDAALLDRIATLKDYTTLCASAPSEVLGLAALRARDSLVKKNRARVSANLDAIEAFARELPDDVSWTRPRGSTVGLLRILGEEPASAFCARLLSETGILGVPSSMFEYGDAHVRLGYGRDDFEGTLGELAQWLRGAS